MGGQCAGANEIVDRKPFVWDPVPGSGTPGSRDHYVGTTEIAAGVLEVGGEAISTSGYGQEGGCDSGPGHAITIGRTGPRGI